MPGETKRWVRVRQVVELVYPVDEDAVKAAAEADDLSWYAQDIEGGDDSELAEAIQVDADEVGGSEITDFVGSKCVGYGEGWQEVEIERWCSHHFGSPVMSEGGCAKCAAARQEEER